MLRTLPYGGRQVRVHQYHTRRTGLPDGKNAEVRKQLKSKMLAAAERRAFEQAAKIRDQISALEGISRKQHAVVSQVKMADVFGLVLKDGWASFHITFVRDSKIIGAESFLLAAPIQNAAEALSEFVPQFYQNRDLPSEVILPLEPIDRNFLLETLLVLRKGFEGEKGPAPQLTVPQKGQKKSLLDTAEKNALFALESERGRQDRLQSIVEATKDQLKLQVLPRRVECIDISNLQGTNTVASLVCFIDAKPARHLYRRYNIASLGQGEQNDFAAIGEVVQRRFERGVSENDFPDLLVIDGGKGQLSAAVGAAKSFKNPLQIISLAKARTFKVQGPSSNDPSRSYERVFFPGHAEPTILKPGSEAFRLLTSLRDEAHRFAIESHRRKRSGLAQESELDLIPGVGKIKKLKLLRIFGTVENLRKATAEEIAQKTGFHKSLCETHSFNHSPSFPVSEANVGNLARQQMPDATAWLGMTFTTRSFPVSEANVGNLPARRQMPDATAWLSMTFTTRSFPVGSKTTDARRHVAGHDFHNAVIPSERSERRESRKTTDARQHHRAWGPLAFLQKQRPIWGKRTANWLLYTALLSSRETDSLSSSATFEPW